MTRVRHFRVTGDYEGNRVCVTITFASDAPDHVQDALRDQAAAEFTHWYPDASAIQRDSWTEETKDDE